MIRNNFFYRYSLTLYLALIAIVTFGFGVHRYSQSDLPSYLFNYQWIMFALSFATGFVSIQIGSGRVELESVFSILSRYKVLIWGLCVASIIYMTFPILLILDYFAIEIEIIEDVDIIILWVWFVIALTVPIWLIFIGINKVTYKSDFVRHLRSKLIANEVTTQQILLTLCLSLFLGYVIGYSRPHLQDAVEQGQILAGTVQYEQTNPWYIYQAKVWNFPSQLAGLGLWLGLTEVQVSLLMSGLIGSVFMCSVALVVLAVTRSIPIALLVPLILFSWTTYGLLTRGYGYPIFIMSRRVTYGMLGMSYMMLILAFFMLKRDRIGFCLLGLSVMMHASLSIWLHLTLLVFIMLDWRNFPQWFKKGLPAIGCYVISLISLLWQRVIFVYPSLLPEVEEEYLRFVVENIAPHSQYILYLDSYIGIFLVFVVWMVGMVWLSGLYKWGGYTYRFICRILLIIIVLGVIGHVVSRLPLHFSNMISVLLPNRFLNLVILIVVTTLLGFGLFLIAEWIYYQINRFDIVSTTSLQIYAQRFSTVVIIFVLIFTFYRYTRWLESRYESLFGIMESPVFLETRKSDGLLLIAPTYNGTQQLQLVTGRPIVLNPLIDGHLPYTLEAVPMTVKIFEKVYNFDFFDSSTTFENSSVAIELTWEKRTTDEWIQLADEFGFTQVLMNADVPLQLPVVVTDDDVSYTLYDIP